MAGSKTKEWEQNRIDEAIRSPASWKVANNSWANILSALVLGGDPNPREGWHGDSPLVVACEQGNPLVAKALLKLGVRANGPLLAAMCSRKQDEITLEIVEMLLKAGVNPNDSPGDSYPPPLHGAILRSSPEVAKLLLSHGADPHQRDSKQLTAFDYARKNKDTSIVAILEDAMQRSRPAQRQ